MERMGFCFLASRDWKNPDSAGGDLYLSNLARSLALRGHRVFYLSQQFPGSPREETADRVAIIRLKSGPRFVIGQLNELLRLRGHVDLIVEEMFGGKKTPAISLPLSRHKLAIAWYQRHDKIFEQQYSKPVARVLSRLERLFARIYRKATVVTLSTKSATELSEIGLSPDQIHIVPSAAILEASPPKVPFQRREDRLVFIGKIRQYKRIDHALRALKLIRESSPENRNVKLVIAGNVSKNDEKYLNGLKDLSNQLGIAEGVEFRIYPGMIPPVDKASLLSNSKLLVQPSPVEGFSMTTVEANLCGTPVIVSDGIPRDVVSHGDNGFVYHFGDIDSMASYSDKLLRDQGLWAQLSSNGLKAARKFGWENSCDLLELLAMNVRDNHLSGKLDSQD